MVSGGEGRAEGRLHRQGRDRHPGQPEFLNGMTVKDAIPVITKWLEEKGIGHAKVNSSCATGSSPVSATGASPFYGLLREVRAGSPFPRTSSPLLPDVESYEPTDDGESPPAR